MTHECKTYIFYNVPLYDTTTFMSLTAQLHGSCHAPADDLSLHVPGFEADLQHNTEHNGGQHTVSGMHPDRGRGEHLAT